MCAISVDDRKLQEEWTQRGVDLGEREPDAAYWAGPLLNNLGWTYVDAGDYDRALELFERALQARRQDPQNRAPIAWAQYAVGQTLRMLGRASEAVPVLEEAAATLPEDADIRQELAEARAAA
jgi:tetratricopeptide (TPR) repeat protein